MQRLAARSAFSVVGAAYLVIKQICSQLVCSMATEAQKVHHQAKHLIICQLSCTWSVAILIQEVRKKGCLPLGKGLKYPAQ